MDATADNPPPEPPQPVSLGRMLSEQRERHGLSRSDVALRLHMSPSQIEAIETGQYERLPKGPFLRGFLRNYAKLLGIPPESVLSQLAETAPPEQAPRIVVPTQNIRFDPIGDRLSNPYVKATVLAAVAVAVAFTVMYWWLFMRGTAPTTVHKPATNGEAVTAAPAQPAVSVPDVPPAAPPVAPAPVAAPAPGTPSNAPAKPEAAKPEAAKADAARAEPSKADAAKVATAGRGIGVLRFHFEAESWVEVRDARDKVLFQQLNPAGGDAEVRGRAPLAVIVGNAHAVQLSYNDKPFPLDPHTKVDVARFTLE